MSEIRTARFVAPDEAREKYDAIIPAYQAAFAAEPWYEVSKCGGCSSGYSRQNPGDICQACGSVTGDEAYTEQELTEKFGCLSCCCTFDWFCSMYFLAFSSPSAAYFLAFSSCDSIVSTKFG